MYRVSQAYHKWQIKVSSLTDLGWWARARFRHADISWYVQKWELTIISNPILDSIQHIAWSNPITCIRKNEKCLNGVKKLKKKKTVHSDPSELGFKIHTKIMKASKQTLGKTYPWQLKASPEFLLVNDKVILLVYLVMLTTYTENGNVYRE